MKPGFKRTVKWNEYPSKVTKENRNQYLDYLIDPNFQGVNMPFALLFGNNPHQTLFLFSSKSRNKEL